jgi:hypothetical protein
MDVMLAKASTLLYDGFTSNMLWTILLLLNLKIVHRVSNVFMNELFSLLHLELLPKVNKLSATTYEALKLVKTLGLNYDSIHACTYTIKFQFIIPFFYIIFYFYFLVNYVSYFIFYFHHWFKQFKHKSHGTQIIYVSHDY